MLEFNLSPHPSSLLLQRQARHYNDTSLLPSASIIQALAYCFTSFFGSRRRVIAKWLNTKCPNGWNCVKTWWWCIPEQCQFWWQITDQSSNHLHSSHPHCSKAAPCLAHLHQWFKLHPVIIQNTPSNIFHNKIFLFCCCFEHLSLSQQLQLPTNFYSLSLWSLWSKGDG